MFERISLTLKMTLITVVVGVLVSGILGYMYSKNLKFLLNEQLKERLGKQAINNRSVFDRHIIGYHQSVVLLTAIGDFLSYVRKVDWSNETPVINHTEIPEWLPKTTVLRLMADFDYALLFDSRRRLRESYCEQSATVPQALANPDHVLFMHSHDQSFLTLIDKIPYVVASEDVTDKTGAIIATLMIATPLDDDFLISVTGSTESDNTVALIMGKNPVIVASSKPGQLPSGTSVQSLKDGYVFTGKSFLDYGETDVRITFASLISTEDVRKLRQHISTASLRMRLISESALIMSFMLIMLFITRRIGSLSKRIVGFLRDNLGFIDTINLRGDQLYVLENRYQLLADEILSYKEDIKKAREELETKVMERTLELTTINERLSTEITERKHAELAIKESGKKYRRLVELAQEGIWVIDETAVTTFVNQRMADMLGYTVGEMTGRSALEFMDEDWQKKLQSNLERRKQGIKEQHDFELIRKDGTKIHTINASSPIFDENGNYEGSITLAADITERKKAEDTLKKSLREKDLLLREIHHRVKNNLQVVSALIGLQMEYVGEKIYKDMFLESKNRIRSIALVHEKLYRSKGLAEIDINEYVVNLTDELLRSLGFDKKQITLTLDIENIPIGIDVAIPCGLIINELFANVLKHAFPDGRSGEIMIGIHSLSGEAVESDLTTASAESANKEEGVNALAGNEVELVVRDNGIGFPSGVDFKKTKSLGLHIVVILVKQIGGTIELNNQNGTEFIIRFNRQFA
ncbi:MAG: PAS domain S-box protein [Nitrospirae bacterium]|nr:PAS domain S-box protein [Nitrospirota bacterium]